MKDFPRQADVHAADRVRNVSLFSGLAPAEIDGILGISRYVAFAPGTHLMRQGQSADGVLILESGTADVLTALPGGGELTLASVGEGTVLGEMALLDAGIRSATVIARTPVEGYWIDRDGFRMLLAQRNAAVFAVQGRVTLALCARLRELNARIVARETPLREAWSLPAQGQSAIRRGAVEVATLHAGGRYRIGILGPGRLCGHMGLIDGVTHSTMMVAREHTTLLEITKPAFDRLYHGCERVNAKFRDAINRNLLEALAHTNNHLTRLISHARIRAPGARRPGEIDELERALCTQDCDTPPA